MQFKSVQFSMDHQRHILAVVLIPASLLFIGVRPGLSAVLFVAAALVAHSPSITVDT